MGAESLAQRIGKAPAHAAELLKLHHATCREFWLDFANLRHLPAANAP